MPCRCCRWRRPTPTTTCEASSSRCSASSGSRATSRWRSPPSPRSTACRSRCATRTASWCRAPRAATASAARTSPPMSAPSRRSRRSLPKAAPDLIEVRGEIYFRKDDFLALNRAADGGRRGALCQCAQHRRRLAPPEGPGGHRRRGRLRFFAYAWGADAARCRPTPSSASSPPSANGASRSIR